MVSEQTKITLDESEIPRQWYNVIPDLPSPPPPPLHPGTGQPVGPEDLAPLFPMELIRQEVSGDSFIDVPAEVPESAESVDVDAGLFTASPSDLLVEIELAPAARWIAALPIVVPAMMKPSLKLAPASRWSVRSTGAAKPPAPVAVIFSA